MLQRREFAEASALAAESTERETVEAVHALRVQVFGLQDQADAAESAFRQLRPPRTQVARELFAELKLRFVDRKSARHPDHWLAERQLLFQVEALRHAA